MPSYVGLWPKERDTPAVRRRKRKTIEDLARLRAALAAHFAAQRRKDVDATRCVRIGTWNLRDFGKEMRGERLDEAIAFIAEIVASFDVVALQEVYRDLRAFERVRRLLGPAWDFIMTDASTSARGNDERMVFAFNTARVRSLNLAGEISLADGLRILLPNSFDLAPEAGPRLSLPPGATIDPPAPGQVRTGSGSNATKLNEEVVLPLPAGTMVELPPGAELVFSGRPADLRADGSLDLKAGQERQFGAGAAVRLPPRAIVAEDMNFARAPFLVQFQSNWLRFSLCTVHIYYGENEAGLKLERRKAEIRHLAQALADKASDEHDSDADSFFMLLGDFNIVARSHGTMEALESCDFEVPEEIRSIPAGSNVARDKFYDQIAVWQGKPRRRSRMRSYASIEVTGAGVFDFYKHVFREGADDPEGADEAYYRARMAEQAETGRARKTYANYRDWRTYQMSDHLPMWIEFRADFADEYLAQARKALGEE